MDRRRKVVPGAGNYFEGTMGRESSEGHQPQLFEDYVNPCTVAWNFGGRAAVLGAWLRGECVLAGALNLQLTGDVLVFAISRECFG
ncbi:hypothetical protein BJP08_10020 [Corynebacterium sp. NML140438]|nr:hypothetical protein BJP08_10020 [Corynebacterium sp. NML140438]